MSDRMKVLVLGGCLVIAGYMIGKMEGRSVTKEVQAATILPDSYSAFISGNGAIVTSSSDGRIIYLWAPSGDQSERIATQAAPVLIGSVDAEGRVTQDN